MENKQYFPLTNLRAWDKNPRDISVEELRRLKKSLLYFGIYKPSLVTPDGEVLGGNMRLRAITDLKKEIENNGEGQTAMDYGVKVEKVTSFWSEIADKGLWVSVVSPENEAQKLEYALSDNDRAGFYLADKLNQLVIENGVDLRIADFKIDLGETSTLSDLLNSTANTLEDEEEKEVEKEAELITCPSCGHQFSK